LVDEVAKFGDSVKLAQPQPCKTVCLTCSRTCSVATRNKNGLPLFYAEIFSITKDLSETYLWQKLSM